MVRIDFRNPRLNDFVDTERERSPVAKNGEGLHETLEQCLGVWRSAFCCGG
jgi:hypothetical protein